MKLDNLFETEHKMSLIYEKEKRPGRDLNPDHVTEPINSVMSCGRQPRILDLTILPGLKGRYPICFLRLKKK